MIMTLIVMRSSCVLRPNGFREHVVDMEARDRGSDSHATPRCSEGVDCVSVCLEIISFYECKMEWQNTTLIVKEFLVFVYLFIIFELIYLYFLYHYI